jgi:hypothetical protein
MKYQYITYKEPQQNCLAPPHHQVWLLSNMQHVITQKTQRNCTNYGLFHWIWTKYAIIFKLYKRYITVTARSKAWTVFARSKAGIVGLNPTQVMEVCCVYSVFLLSSGFAMGWSLVLLEYSTSVKRFVSLQFLNLRHSVGLLSNRNKPNKLYKKYTTQIF